MENAWIIDEGAIIKIGKALIKRDATTLYIKDLYGDGVFTLDPDSFVEIIPIPPIYRLARITNTLYLKILTPIVGLGGKSYWLTLPYEVALVVNGTTIAILSPFKVKYTLFGSIVEGMICRYHETTVLGGEGISTDYALTLAVTPLSIYANMYSYALINMQSVKLYRSKNELRVYYEMIRLPSNTSKPYAEPLGKAPKEGLEEVKVPGDVESLSEGVLHEYYGPD